MARSSEEQVGQETAIDQLGALHASWLRKRMPFIKNHVTPIKRVR